jgi:hypothetical protein
LRLILVAHNDEQLKFQKDCIPTIYPFLSPEDSLVTPPSLTSLTSLPNPLKLKSLLKFLVKFLNPSLIFAPVTPSIGVVCARGNLSATELSALDKLAVSNRDVDEVYWWVSDLGRMVRGVRRGDWSVKSVWEDMVELKSSRKGFCSALRIPWDLVCIEHDLKMKKVVILP